MEVLHSSKMLNESPYLSIRSHVSLFCPAGWACGVDKEVMDIRELQILNENEGQFREIKKIIIIMQLHIKVYQSLSYLKYALRITHLLCKE